MNRSLSLSLALLALLAAVPFLAPLWGLEYYMAFAMRLLITMLIASSLNLLMGYGGMVALGHAGFVGVGAYAMVALLEAGVQSAWVLWAGAALSAALVALLIGAISLRTRGVYFIMITLAFAQMLYYVAVSLRRYGGDDGYNLAERPALGWGLDAGDDRVLYLVVLGLCALIFALMQRVTDSRFGKVLVGVRDNEGRMRALGYPTYLLQLQAFALTAAVAGLGGALLLTQNAFVSPSSMHWSQSAVLIVMVVLGGLGHRFGGVVGAAVWLLLEENLRQSTEYWHWPLGLLLIGIILFAPQGLCRFRLALPGERWRRLGAWRTQ
jgi:branched-chain amino acid transport system permease protein